MPLRAADRSAASSPRRSAAATTAVPEHAPRLPSETNISRFADAEQELEPFAPVLFRLFPDLAPLASDITVQPQLNLEQERQRLFAALALFFAHQAAQQPVLLIVEDLHWSDEGSLDFLLYLMRRFTTQPLMLIGTYRGDEVSTRLGRWLADLDREHLSQELHIAALTRDEVAAMLRARADVGAPLAAVEQFTRALAASGELAATIDEADLRDQFLRTALASLPQEHTPTLQRAEAERFGGLTERERAVAMLIAKGHSNQEIATALVVSKRTVETHVGNVMAKIGVTTRAQIVVWAIGQGLVPPS